MPLDGTYEWEETPERVVVRIPLRGADRKSLDVLATPRFVKVNYAPYLVQLDLVGDIDETKCSAKLKSGDLLLTLVKQEAGVWGKLVVEGLSKTELRARRGEELRRKRERDEDRRKQAAERAAQDERLAVRKQMAIDEAERRHVEELKEEEKANAEADVYAELERVDREARAPGRPQAAGERGERKGVTWADDRDLSLVDERAGARPSDSSPRPPDAPSAATSAAAAADEAVDDDDDLEEFDMASSDEEGSAGSADGEPEEGGDEAAAEEAEPVYVPPPRQGSAVTVSFTPRLFPTPMRESKREEEDNWIARNRRFLKNNPNARDVGERDPVWLKGKGDEFYQAGDFRSAVNAYSAALEADALLAPALSNRAACNLRLRNSAACIEDCSALLAMMPRLAEAEGSSEIAVRKRERLQQRALLRRGAAHTLAHDYESAVSDLRAARAAGADGVEDDLAQAEDMLDCARRKAGADAKQRAGELGAACEAYDGVLARQPRYLACLANRSACRMQQGEWQGVVEDCTVVLALLRKTERGVAAPEGELPVGPVPGPDDPKRRLMKLKTLLRRAEALEQVDALQACAKDLALASKMDPDNAELAARAGELRARVGAST